MADLPANRGKTEPKDDFLKWHFIKKRMNYSLNRTIGYTFGGKLSQIPSSYHKQKWFQLDESKKD